MYSVHYVFYLVLLVALVTFGKGRIFCTVMLKVTYFDVFFFMKNLQKHV